MRLEKLAAAAGYAAMLGGGAAVALERPWPSTSDPASLPDFLAGNRAANLGRSMLFLTSAGLFRWFLGSVRSYLITYESGTGRVTSIAFGAGMVAYGLNVIGRARRSP